MQWRLFFSGAESVGWTVTVAVCAAAALVLCLLLMRYERRLVSPKVGAALIAVRVLVIAWLVIIMLQPVVTSEWDESQTGRVIIAVDVSQSMETRDRHAARAEKLRWAVALGMLDERLAGDAGDDRGDRPPDNGANADNDDPDDGVPPGFRVDDADWTETERQQAAEVIDEFDRMTRSEFVQRLLDSPPRRMLDSLQRQVAIDLRLFAGEQTAIDAESWRRTPATDGMEVRKTDAVKLISEVLSEPDRSRVRAIVLLSDGRQTEPGDLAGEGRRLGSLDVPVFTVPIGSRLKPRDISIASVESPEAVFLNDRAMLNVVLGTSGFEGRPITVVLERDGREIESRSVTPATDSLHVAFEAPTEETGRFDYRVRVAEQPGELRSDNNLRDFSFRVVDNKGQVLIVDGDARWELRYLKNLLDRDEQVDSRTVVFRQPWLQLLNRTFIERSLPDPDAFRDQLADTDLLIVGDVPPEQLTAAMWQQIDDAVSRDGLTLVVIPGRRALRALETLPIVHDLLPVEEPESRLAEQYLASPDDGTQTRFQLTTTDAAEPLPMFRFADAENPAARLEELPGHPWVATGRPKASATVWAWAANPADDSEREAVIVHQYYGFGQVVWMGTDSTWRWRRRRGDSLHHKFWGQLVRWAARNRAAAGNDQVRLTLSDVVVDEEESVEVVARFTARAAASLADRRVQVIVRPAGSEETATTSESTDDRVTLLRPTTEFPERLTGRIPPLPAGTWTVTLGVEGMEPPDEPIQSELVVQPRKSPELANVSCHRDLLRQLSHLSGGELIEPWDIDRLAELVRPDAEDVAVISEHSLWDNWPALIVFFGLLMTEWVTRKLHGLP